MSTVTFQNGNKEITATITSSQPWEGGENVRTYYTIAFTGKREPIANLYEVHSGSTHDHTVTVNGRTFAYKYGTGADSKTKRRAIDEAVVELVAQI